MPKRKRLSDVLRQVPGVFRTEIPDIRISGVSYDSRVTTVGDIFFAISGINKDGHQFIPDAIKNGAVAVVGTQSMEGLPVPYIQVKDSRQAMAYIAASLYDFPARNLVMIGITGTDGKTTTAQLIYYILLAAGFRAGLITTVNAKIGDEIIDTGFHVTTPEAIDIQNYLSKMLRTGLTHVILETTSHGLAQHRVTACEFDIGVVTNITHEHLDFHGSYQAYREAKGRLFAGLVETKPKDVTEARGAVLNRDDGSYEYLSSLTKVPEFSYGYHPRADVTAVDINFTEVGINFVAEWRDQGQSKTGKKMESIPISSLLTGEYNVANCLAAITAAQGVLGIDPKAIQQGIRNLQFIPGRMERINLGQDFTAIVDFAHTPSALEVALESSRNRLQNNQSVGRLIVVFGSAGLRDKKKRRMMAEVSAELADMTILTAEDPRTESLANILQEMAEGVESRGGVEGVSYLRIPDRGEAIRHAVSIAETGDIIMALGKGHEQSLCFGDVEYPWDDRTAMRAALAEHLGIEGPEMPYLPTQD